MKYSNLLIAAIFVVNATGCSEVEISEIEIPKVEIPKLTESEDSTEAANRPQPKTSSQYISPLPDDAPKYFVGVIINEPYMKKDDVDNLDGYDVELLRTIGEEQGFKVGFRLMPFQQIFPAINDRTIDLAMSGLSLTEERKQVFATSKPYSKAKAGYLTLSDSPYQSVEKLNDKKIAVPSGSSLQKILNENTAVTVVPTDSLFLSFKAIFTGDADATFGMQPNVIERAKVYDNKSFNFVPLTDDIYTVVYARKDSQALIDQINEGLDKLKKNGKYQQINKKWFGVNSENFSVK